MFVRVETLVLDLENTVQAKRFRYLNCTVLNDTDLENKCKEVRLNSTPIFFCLLSCALFFFLCRRSLYVLDAKIMWRSLRLLLCHQVPDLMFIVINGFKRTFKVGKAYNLHDLVHMLCCHIAVDKYEYKLSRPLLGYSLGSETMTIRTSDVYLVGEVEETVAVNCNNTFSNSYVGKMDITQWDKMILSLPRGTPRAKIDTVEI